jgi:hypothetical protein
MALWAVVAIAIYTVVNATVSRFQLFTLTVARATSAEMGGDSRRQVRALQRFMTPTLVGSIGWLTYIALAIAFVFAYRSWGWYGGGPVLAWGYLGAMLLARVWPLPSRELCARIAAAEVRREDQMPHLEPAERNLVRSCVFKQLELAGRG